MERHSPCQGLWEVFPGLGFKLALHLGAPLDFPSFNWLEDLMQLAEFDGEAWAAHDLYQKRTFRKFEQQLDTSEGHFRLGFCSLRGPSRPPFASVSSQVVQVACRLIAFFWERSVSRCRGPSNFVQVCRFQLMIMRAWLFLLTPRECMLPWIR